MAPGSRCTPAPTIGSGVQSGRAQHSSRRPLGFSWTGGVGSGLDVDARVWGEGSCDAGQDRAVGERGRALPPAPMRGAPMGTDLLTGSAGKARHGPWSWPIASVQAGLGEQRRDRRARGARGPARVVEFLTKHTQLSRRRLHGYRPSDARGAQVHGRARAYAADRLVERAQRASMQPRVAANAGADPGWPAAALSSCAACSSAHAQS
jgi:hypothetical protein